MNNLYDVFCCIAEDEGKTTYLTKPNQINSDLNLSNLTYRKLYQLTLGQHVATMEACQDPEVIIRSPNTEAGEPISSLIIGYPFPVPIQPRHSLFFHTQLLISSLILPQCLF